MHILLSLPLVTALLLSAHVCAAAESQIKIGLIGDSTVAEQSGWGPAFAGRFNEGAEIINYAKNGATLEALSRKLDALVELEPDYVLIQFGHNDQKRYDTAVYSDHLRSYVERIRKSGGKAVIVSSVTRRSFDADGKIVSNLVKNEKYSYKGTLTEYANAAEAVAGELNLPFIDLHRASIAHHNKIGREESMSYNFKEGDKTHFNRKGAEAITNLILKEIETAVPELSGWLHSEVALVAETHQASLAARERALRKTIARDTAWPPGVWGENLWCLAALSLDEKTDEANRRLLEQAKAFVHLKQTAAPVSSPEDSGNLPWTFFSITDYIRILYLFHGESPHFAGRLKPETEAAMKEVLWLWVRGQSRLDQLGQEDQFVLLGTENHDLNRRPPCYLITAILKDDPEYRDRKLEDGHRVTEHAAAYVAYFREWPGHRAKNGLWIEMGSNTYQKYSWPALFNLHELSPDPVIRHRFGLLLDLAFIEEAQISVQGLRGGGRSRASGDKNGFAGYKNLLFARAGQAVGSSHSRVIETSRYQLPPAAILLDQLAFPATAPFAIRNRVPGELEAGGEDGQAQRIAPASSLINYAWRTPHYLLGSTLQNPKLEYAGISRQKRWCGLLFDDPAAATVGSIGVEIEKGRGGRPQHSFWSVQHENVLLLQRIARGREGGSYSTGEIRIRFDAPGLELVDEEGWIFASNGKAFAGVKFLDGGHRWDETRSVASPAKFTGPADTGRILLHAGDVSAHGSFAQFRSSLLDSPLKVAPSLVDYRFGEEPQRIEMFRYDAADRDAFKLPRINGKSIDLAPKAVYQSPYLNGDSQSDRVTVTVGPVRRVLDFASRQ